MINACKILNDLATAKQGICSYEEAEMFTDLVYMLTLSDTELNAAMDNFKRKYVSLGIEVGDECYYDSNPNDRFIVTKILLERDGLDHPAYFFDGIYHDGTTISDGNLQIIHKTGNYYPIMNALLSPFDEPPAEVKEDGKV